MNLMSKQTKFILTIALQLAIIFVIIIFKFSIFTGGVEVMLHIEPVDPHDPLRGDYVTFSYNISNISSDYFNYSPVNNGDKVYVPLKKRGKYWQVSGNIQKSKPDQGIFIKGVVKRGEESVLPQKSFNIIKEDALITIIYGTEEYFIPEGAGRSERFTGNNNFAKVAIDENGNAVLKQIFIDNKIWP